MVVFGVIGFGLFGMVLMGVLFDEDVKVITQIVVATLFALSIFMLVYDITSPTYIAESREFLTNDYGSYELNVDNDTLGLVEEIKIEPTRKFTICKKEVKYYFKEFVEGVE